jgi:hypothetical protein
MKALTLSIVTLALATSALTPTAEAYYSRQDAVNCNDQAAGNAVAGAVIGGVIGALLGSQGHNPGMGAALGAAAGGSLGLGLSCREQTVYMDNVDRYLDDDRFDSPYQWDGGSVMVTRSFVRPDGVVCDEYQTSVRTPRGWVNKTEVACRVRGFWVHGFNPQGFRMVRDYRRPMGPPRGPFDRRDDFHRGGFRHR